jgi:hypothetical protein
MGPTEEPNSMENHRPWPMGGLSEVRSPHLAQEIGSSEDTHGILRFQNS